MIDYFQMALKEFNTDKPNWYGWKKEDSEGNKIPNDQRMTYANIIIIKEGATIPSESQINAKIEELKQAETDSANKKASAKSKLEALGLTTEEIKEAFGI
tara:strand:- start:246 stop:545 length:300 start_codon:yes stop_codon:yes gene_type:complete